VLFGGDEDPRCRRDACAVASDRVAPLAEDARMAPSLSCKVAPAAGGRRLRERPRRFLLALAKTGNPRRTFAILDIAA
jgi:hypothetical protein